MRLPAAFVPTHPTKGLPDYPARDFFGRPGEEVVAQFAGRVRRLSGRPCAQGGSPGGSYGRSLYVAGGDGSDRFLTHFARLAVAVGAEVRPGTVLGTVCDSAASGKPNASHIHYGLRKATAPPVKLYDVLGPKGGLVTIAEPLEVLVAWLPRWLALYDTLTIRRSPAE